MTQETAFSVALDRGLRELSTPLDRVVFRLRQHGVSCSASTLSLWRRGRTRPAMPRSEPVVSALESVLKLGPGALHDALAEPDPGQPDWWAQRVPIHLYDDVEQAFHEFREGAGLPHGDHLERLRVHLRATMGPGRTPERAVLSSVVRADRDDVSRLGAFHYSTDRTDDGQPVMFEVERVLGARVVDHVPFARLGAVAALLELERPLDAGEITSLEVHWVRVTDPPPAPPTDFYEMRHPWPVQHLGLEVCFEDELPARLSATRAARLAPDASLADLPHEELTPAPCVQLAVDDAVGGGARLTWVWEGAGE